MIYKKNLIKIKGRQFFVNVSFFVFFGIITYAQQTPHYTQYLYNMQILNPAFLGTRADLSITFLSRQQWVGIEGAPKTQTFSINGRTISGFAFGATVINDQIGLTNSTNINLDASYTIPTSQYSRISLGLKGGLTFFNNNLSNGITPDNDVYASNNGKFPNIGFGALYYNEKIFLGLSIPNLLKSNQFQTRENFTTKERSDNSNYFLATGAIYNLTKNFKLKPTTIIKYTPTLPLTIDINTNVVYKNIIETGMSYRYKNSITTLFAVIINNKYRIGYSYDYRLANYGSNLSSHEISLRFDFELNRNKRWLFHNNCYF